MFNKMQDPKTNQTVLRVMGGKWTIYQICHVLKMRRLFKPVSQASILKVLQNSIK